MAEPSRKLQGPAHPCKRTVNTAISGWTQVGTSTEPIGRWTQVGTSTEHIRQRCSHFLQTAAATTCRGAQTAQNWGRGSRAISSGLPRCGTWTQLPRLWFPPCLKKKKKKKPPMGLDHMAQGCSSPLVSTSNPSASPAAPLGTWPCNSSCQGSLGRLSGAFLPPPQKGQGVLN